MSLSDLIFLGREFAQADRRTWDAGESLDERASAYSDELDRLHAKLRPYLMDAVTMADFLNAAAHIAASIEAVNPEAEAAYNGAYEALVDAQAYLRAGYEADVEPAQAA